jgi:hypothetical protein
MISEIFSKQLNGLTRLIQYTAFNFVVYMYKFKLAHSYLSALRGCRLISTSLNLRKYEIVYNVCRMADSRNISAVLELARWPERKKC